MFIQYSISSNDITATKDLYEFPVQVEVQTLEEHFHNNNKLLKRQSLCTNNTRFPYATSNPKIKTEAMSVI